MTDVYYRIYWDGSDVCIVEYYLFGREEPLTEEEFNKTYILLEEVKREYMLV